MKLTFFLLAASFMQVSATVYSQDKFTLDYKHISAEKVFSRIQKESSYRFFYTENDIRKLGKVNVQVKDATLPDILNHLLSNGLTYKIVGDKMVVISSLDAINAQITVKGTVTDSSGTPLVGVTVKVKGESKGVVTDVNGTFSIVVPDDAVLIISYIGYQRQEITLNSKTKLHIVLQSSNSALSGVVVVGYGTQKKVNLTGSVATVSAKDLEDKPITQASQALAGLMTGVTVSQASGQPGNNGAAITIRGIGSYGAGGGPLVLVDGLATSINDVDPNNIASISVLKDAASASIYGSRAANGVILIETKSGKKGKLQVNYSGYVGWQKATTLPNFVPSWKYAVLRNEAN